MILTFFVFFFISIFSFLFFLVKFLNFLTKFIQFLFLLIVYKLILSSYLHATLPTHLSVLLNLFRNLYSTYYLSENLVDEETKKKSSICFECVDNVSCDISLFLLLFYMTCQNITMAKL
uniref:Uncharacterized protein n=1 Tax=Cacopsylla melanoneura TaxID=428564 RepID=A0A8D9E4V2_9HEMI